MIEEDRKVRADWQKLTDKQRNLVKRYLATGNKLGSYNSTYYPNGWGDTKRRTVVTNCYAEFRKPHIKLIIEQIQEKAVASARISYEDIVDTNVDDLLEAQHEVNTLKIDTLWVLKRAALLADFNINDFIVVKGGVAFYDFSKATKDDWYCISEYTNEQVMVEGGEDLIPANKVKIKPYDKLRALELVGKHVDVGAFKDKVELSGDENNPVQTVTRTIIKKDKSNES